MLFILRIDAVYHPIVCRETTAAFVERTVERGVYHPIVCRETTAWVPLLCEQSFSISPYCL